MGIVAQSEAMQGLILARGYRTRKKGKRESDTREQLKDAPGIRDDTNGQPKHP